LLEQMREEVQQAEVVIFLGFAFHAQNMALITPEDPRGGMKEVFATALNFSEQDCRIIRNYILALYPPHLRKKVEEGVHLNIRRDLTSTKLFDEYGRTMAKA
jgi:hypothetical protein